uniref:Uncharacterized protein n=1 Tax=Arundo donax TaxID=35708 RepID=A0A0A9E067_ARUDO
MVTVSIFNIVFLLPFTQYLLCVMLLENPKLCFLLLLMFMSASCDTSAF